jgi:hypothetical protein
MVASILIDMGVRRICKMVAEFVPSRANAKQYRLGRTSPIQPSRIPQLYVQSPFQSLYLC